MIGSNKIDDPVKSRKGWLRKRLQIPSAQKLRSKAYIQVCPNDEGEAPEVAPPGAREF